MGSDPRRQALRCHAHRTNGDPCRAYAMLGKTVCKVHGGKAGRPITHGRYSKFLRNHPETLAAYEEMRDDPKAEETINEIAVLRALLGQWLEKFGATVHPDAIAQSRELAEAISKAVERRYKQAHGELIRISESDLQAGLRQTLEAVREVYGSDERYQQLLAALSRRHLAARD
ncbi:MAG: hypothetical protein NUW22_04730 [Acidobacteria bacterium]|nr:hypothetical protein [Acidobacteriota bacterium]